VSWPEILEVWKVGFDLRKQSRDFVNLKAYAWCPEYLRLRRRPPIQKGTGKRPRQAVKRSPVASNVPHWICTSVRSIRAAMLGESATNDEA